jgi:hypothetical protein
MVKRKNSEEGQSILGLGDLYRTFNISGDFFNVYVLWVRG